MEGTQIHSAHHWKNTLRQIIENTSIGRSILKWAGFYKTTSVCMMQLAILILGGEGEVSSILTNTSAMTALQVLNTHNRTLAETQNRISTGFKVSSAKDSGSIYAIAQSMRANTAAWGAVNQSLLRAQGILDVAASAAASVTDILTELKSLAVSLNDTSLDTSSQQAIRQEISALLKSINITTKSSVYNGINLLEPKYEPPIVYAKNYGAENTINDTTTLDGRPGLVTFRYTISNALDTSMQYVDLDDNKVITKAEIDDYYGHFALPQADADQLLAKADLDGSGDLSDEEWNAYIARPAFSSLDADADGQADLTELEDHFTDAGLNATQAASIFNLMDTDADNVVTALERNAYYVSIPDYPVFVHIGMSGTDLDGTSLSYANGHFIDQSTTLLYGDHSEFSVRPPSDVRFNAGMTSPVPVLPKGSDEYYIDLREVIYQPLVSKVSVLSNPDGELYDIYRRGMTVDALGLNNADAMTPQNLLSAIENALKTALRNEAGFGRQQKAVEQMLSHTMKLGDALQAGIGNLVDADMAKESAKLQAGQVKQQLATQSLAIANDQPTWILNLFR